MTKVSVYLLHLDGVNEAFVFKTPKHV